MKSREQAVKLWLSGATYDSIGFALGVSRQRAHQILKPPPSIYRALRTAASGRCQQCSAETLNGHAHHLSKQGRTAENFNDLDNLRYLCKGCHRKSHSDGPMGRRILNLRMTMHDEQMLAALKVRYPWLKEAQITRFAWASLLGLVQEKTGAKP